MTEEQVKQVLANLFREIKAVPQGYDIDWWTEKDQLRATDELGWSDTFEDVIKESVENLMKTYKFRTKEKE